VNNKTAVVMDSTGYLSDDIIADLGIKIVPLNVIIGNETYLETELSNEELFAKLKQISGFSRTSQPSVGMFATAYQELFEKGYSNIISIHLSRMISGTINAAEMARELFSNKEAITIIDSGSSASGLGLLAWSAGEMAKQNLPADEIVDRLKRLKEETKLYFIVDTLEYLHRGGRIGGAAALFGTLLQIKPILYFNPAGEIDVFDKVRSRSKAIQRVLKELDPISNDHRQYKIAVIHVLAYQEAVEIQKFIQSKFEGHIIKLFEAGPVIGTHIGPGGLGVAFQPNIT